ncbi:hypothetical protein OCK74_24795 [Chitinophagaceae bacterium LB-8]|uniref:Transposase n=1 Tax=Paraflavisolibacter caeni TaxID=2982496 RepID=A0A9X2Y0J6_9BACT|nr:transposase [Paraflavisolibacter caeni]MCU7552361.1 hypothetical protein [Paraflavisolibacter caeni]
MQQQGNKGRRGRRSLYDQAFMRVVAREYQTSDLSMKQLALKYGLGHTQLKKWIARFSLELSAEALTLPLMTPEEQKTLEALQKQNQELLKGLQLAQLKISGLELMIDQAEQELNVDIRKKPGTKQSKA